MILFKLKLFFVIYENIINIMNAINYTKHFS